MSSRSPSARRARTNSPSFAVLAGCATPTCCIPRVYRPTGTPHPMPQADNRPVHLTNRFALRRLGRTRHKLRRSVALGNHHGWRVGNHLHGRSRRSRSRSRNGFRIHRAIQSRSRSRNLRRRRVQIRHSRHSRRHTLHLEAGPAKHRSSLGWLEWHRRLNAARRARRSCLSAAERQRGHPVCACSFAQTRTLRFTQLAALRVVLKLLVVEENLLPGGKHKVIATVGALQQPIVKLHGTFSQRGIRLNRSRSLPFWPGMRLQTWCCIVQGPFFCSCRLLSRCYLGNLTAFDGEKMLPCSIRPPSIDSAIRSKLRLKRFSCCQKTLLLTERVSPALFEPFYGSACVRVLPSRVSFRLVSGKRSGA